MSTSIATRSSSIESINPATAEVIATFDQFTPAQVEQALVEAETAFRHWRAQSFAERSNAMRRAAELLRQRKDRYAGLITAEMGKPITQAEAEGCGERRPGTICNSHVAYHIRDVRYAQPCCCMLSSPPVPLSPSLTEIARWGSHFEKRREGSGPGRFRTVGYRLPVIPGATT